MQTARVTSCSLIICGIAPAPMPPGPALVTGVVRDTFQATLDGVEISIAKLQRRAFTSVEGVFRFDKIPKGPSTAVRRRDPSTSSRWTSSRRWRSTRACARAVRRGR